MSTTLTARGLKLGRKTTKFHFEDSMPARRRKKDDCEQKVTRAFQKALASQAVGHVEAKLNDVKKEVDRNSDTISKHTQMLSSLDLATLAHKETHNAILGQLQEMGKKLDAIGTVKLNGGPPVPLSDALKQLYEITAPVRSKEKLVHSWERWQRETRLGRIASSKLGKIVVGAAGLFALASVLHVVGILKTDPWDALAWAITHIIPII